MSDLLETLRALAPVVTPGEWKVEVDIRTDFYGSSRTGPAYIAGYNIGGKSTEVVGCEGIIPGPHAEHDATAIVTLRNALPELIAALEVVELVRDEDWLAERIDDSLDVDWRPIDCARGIIAALPKETDNG